jgi:hypothetical protein
VRRGGFAIITTEPNELCAELCWQPHVKGLTIMVNSIFNGNRREDIWLDK